MANTLQRGWKTIVNTVKKISNWQMEKECLAQLERGNGLKYDEYKKISYSSAVFEKAVTIDRFAYRCADIDIKNNYDIAYSALKNTTPLDDFPKHFFNDRHFMMEALQNDHSISGRGLFYASAALQNDKEIVLYAYQKNYENLYFASDELLNDIDFMTPLLQNKYPEIQNRIKQEPLVRIMISINKYDLAKCDIQFRNNKQLAIDFITHYNVYISSFTDEIKDDEKIAWLALEHTTWEYFSLSDRLKADKHIIDYCLEQEPSMFRNMPDFIRNDKAYVLRIAPHFDDFAHFIGEDLKKEIGNADVLQYLLADKLKNELQHALPQTTIQKRRNKI